LAGNNCDYLTITSREKKDNVAQRKCVIISARVHPGETVGSWMMRGVIKFITDPANIEARLLRENFIFKIIPMLNPDGVINGNYRCSLAGCDLNRRWKNPSKVIHPTVYHTKKLIKESHEERGVYLFCDLHGHSRKNNIFMYGCHNQKVPEETRIFPYLLSKISSYFCYDSSRFGNQKSKESTARISLYKDLKNVPNIFTMESTFSGMDYGPQKGVHLSTDDLENMGRDLCRAVLVYSEIYFPKDLSTVH
jgi:cytosolic carboxypeptidase protein 2/3